MFVVFLFNFLKFVQLFPLYRYFKCNMIVKQVAFAVYSPFLHGFNCEFFSFRPPSKNTPVGGLATLSCPRCECVFMMPCNDLASHPGCFPISHLALPEYTPHPSAPFQDTQFARKHPGSPASSYLFVLQCSKQSKYIKAYE